uniref:Uncharacterized protein n=1 Tax=Cacopsylla melanoneura TaxID=428564 RepID=A0A8D8Z285_9HEMI
MTKVQGQRKAPRKPSEPTTSKVSKPTKKAAPPKPKPSEIKTKGSVKSSKQNSSSSSTFSNDNLAQAKNVRFSTSVASTPIPPSPQTLQKKQLGQYRSPVSYVPRLTRNQAKSQSQVISKTRTPTTVDAKEVEIENLRALNAQLLRRLKSLEEDLKNTKESYELLSASQQPTLLPSPSITPEPVPVIPTPTYVTNPIPGPSYVEDPITTRPRLLVCGDSMVRGFSDILQHLLPRYLVQCLTYPGAGLSTVLNAIPSQTADFTKRDIVFLLAGSNDIPNLSPKILETELQRLSGLCASTNVVFSSIPFMFNLEKHNTNVFATNLQILKLSSVYNFFYFECNFYLSRKMFTSHGLHLNLAGKQAYCEKLSSALSVVHLSQRSFLLPILVDPEPNMNNSSDEQLILDISCPYDPLLEVTNPDESRGNTVLENIDDSSFFLTNLQVFPNL